MRQTKKLSAKEELFCWYCAQLGNAREAAVRAGYLPSGAEQQAHRLLQKPAVREEIRRQEEDLRRQAGTLAVRGLARLAFCAANDAAELLVRGEPPDAQTLAGLDLFCVAEMKQVKGGGMEMKFFDRLKALELLLRCAQEESAGGQAASLYEALEKGAAAVAGTVGGTHAV